MVNIHDVDANELIEKAAEALKQVKEIHPPEWAPYVKTGVSRQRPPVRKDWWYSRSAAVLRTVYRMGPIGTSKLRTKYGSKANLGYAPEHHAKGSGNIIRKVLQGLEKAGLVKQVDIKGRKGRVITGKGKSFLDKIATQIYKPTAPKMEQKAEVKMEAPQNE